MPWIIETDQVSDRLGPSGPGPFGGLETWKTVPNFAKR